MVSRMFMWPTDHDGTIRWPLHSTFQKWSVEGPCYRQQPRVDHLQHTTLCMYNMNRTAKMINSCGLATQKQHRHSLRGTTHKQFAWHCAQTAGVDQLTMQTTHVARIKYHCCNRHFFLPKIYSNWCLVNILSRANYIMQKPETTHVHGVIEKNHSTY